MKSLLQLGALMLVAALLPTRSKPSAHASPSNTKRVPSADRLFRLGLVSSLGVGYAAGVFLLCWVWICLGYSTSESLLRAGSVISALGALLGAFAASNLKWRKSSMPSTFDELDRRAETKDRLNLAAWLGVIAGASLAFSALMMTPAESDTPQNGQDQYSAGLE